MNTHHTKMLPSFYVIQQNFKKILFYSVLAVLVYFLFEAGGVGEERHRLIQGIWNLGHIVLFMLLCMACLNTALLNKRSLVFKVSIVTLASLILGTATEALQLLVQREFSIDDIANDLIGAYLALLIQRIMDKRKTTTTRVGASMLAILFLSIGFRDFVPTVIDEIALYENFPVLASFESDAEIARWEFIDVNAARNEHPFISGRYALKVEYLPAVYPSISLVHLKSDWRGYEQLSLSIYSINRQDIPFEIKVHDKYHTRNRGGYNDRFNKNITLKQGWNLIKIPISEIAAAPKGRFMDMSEINKISLFTHKLLKPTTLYIDDIRLM